MESMLQAAGLRVTRQRLAVVQALASAPHPLTAQELHRRLTRRGGGPGLATIYRTLGALAAAGLADTFPRGGEMAFRLCRPGHHHHVVCESCGWVEEVEAEEVEAWVARMARRRRFRVRHHRADIYGRCPACR